MGTFVIQYIFDRNLQRYNKLVRYKMLKYGVRVCVYDCLFWKVPDDVMQQSKDLNAFTGMAVLCILSQRDAFEK